MRKEEEEEEEEMGTHLSDGKELLSGGK